MEKLKVASLFCGCGGCDLGAIGGFTYLDKYYKPLNTKIVYANDIDKNACLIYEANFDHKVDNRDIKNVDSKAIADCDILIGGFPCQSFSIVATNPPRLGIADERGKLFFQMCRILKDKRPWCFIAENVKGILNANKKEAFALILKEFEHCGYKVVYELLNAASFGVPQKRERVIIVGFREDLNINFKFPKALITNAKDFVPLQKVLEKNVDEKYFFSQKAVDGMLKVKDKMNKGRAQDIAKPCNTVGAHLCKVSLNSTDPVLLDNGRYRRFTPYEVAQIQAFPKSFKLVGSQTAQYRALGNAVPPVMFYYVMRAVIEHLDKACIQKKA